MKSALNQQYCINRNILNRLFIVACHTERNKYNSVYIYICISLQELVISPDHDHGENLKTSIDQQNIEINLNNKDSELCGDINFLLKKCSCPQFKMQDIRDRIPTDMQDEESKGSTDGSENLDVMQIKLTNA